MGSLLITALLLDGSAGDRLRSFIQGYLDFTVLSGVGYVPYLAIMFFLPSSWSSFRKRVAAILLSPLIALFMILPIFLFFALICGMTVGLPVRGQGRPPRVVANRSRSTQPSTGLFGSDWSAGILWV